MAVENRNCDIIPIQIIVIRIFMGGENIGLPASLFNLYSLISNGEALPISERQEIYRLKETLCTLTRADSPNLKNSFMTCLGQTIEERQATCPLAGTCPIADPFTRVSLVDGRGLNSHHRGKKTTKKTKVTRQKRIVQPLDVSFTYEPDLIYAALLERVGNSENSLATEAEQHLGLTAERLLGAICRTYEIKSPLLAVTKLMENARKKMPEARVKYAEYMPEI